MHNVRLLRRYAAIRLPIRFTQHRVSGGKSAPRWKKQNQNYSNNITARGRRKRIIIVPDVWQRKQKRFFRCNNFYYRYSRGQSQNRRGKK